MGGKVGSRESRRVIDPESINDETGKRGKSAQVLFPLSGCHGKDRTTVIITFYSTCLEFL